MSPKILFILLTVGLILVQVTNSQSDLSNLVNALLALVGGILEIVPDDSGVFAALAQLLSGIMMNVDPSVTAAQMAALQQAVEKRANCGILKDGQQYYIQSTNGSYKGYIQSSIDAVDRLRGAKLTTEITSASKFIVVQKSCNVYGLCVRGLCMSRCEGCYTGTDLYQTVAFHLSDTTGSYSQWTLSAIGDVASGPYKLKSDIEQYLHYVRKGTDRPLVSLNAVPLPESEFKFIEVEPCTGMLVNGQEYYLKTKTGDYVVVKGVLGYFEQIEQASATKFRTVQWDCNVYGLCITGTNGDQCMSRCQDCVSETMDFQSVQWHVSDSVRPYSQWKLNTVSDLLELYAEGGFGNVYYNNTASGAKQLVLNEDESLEFDFIKVT